MAEFVTLIDLVIDTKRLSAFFLTLSFLCLPPCPLRQLSPCCCLLSYLFRSFCFLSLLLFFGDITPAKIKHIPSSLSRSVASITTKRWWRSSWTEELVRILRTMSCGRRSMLLRPVATQDWWRYSLPSKSYLYATLGRTVFVFVVWLISAATQKHLTAGASRLIKGCKCIDNNRRSRRSHIQMYDKEEVGLKFICKHWTRSLSTDGGFGP